MTSTLSPSDHRSTEFPVGAARAVAGLVVLLTIIAILSIGQTGLPGWSKWPVGLGLLIYGGWQARRLLAPRWIRLDPASATVHAIDGPWDLLMDARGNFVSPVYLGLYCRRRRDGRRRRLGLFRGQIDPNGFRQLCARLRQVEPE